MNDPNRIVERVQRLVSTAVSAIDEAITIIDNAKRDGEDPLVIEAAQAIMDKEMGDGMD